MLPDEIRDAPAPVALLDIAHRKCRHLGPTRPTAKKYSENLAIAKSLSSRNVRGIQEFLRLKFPTLLDALLTMLEHPLGLGGRMPANTNDQISSEFRYEKEHDPVMA